jgi:hypothetical protein
MGINELVIWVSLAMLGVGLDKVTTNTIYGLILCVIGVIGAAYGIREHLLDSRANVTQMVVALVVIVTWAAVFYDIYDRHFGASAVVAGHYVRPADWKDRGELEAHVGESFRHRNVPLDGRNYSACIFEDVTFQYRGTGPYQLVNNTYIGTNKVDVGDNAGLNCLPMVLMALGTIPYAHQKDVIGDMLNWLPDNTTPQPNPSVFEKK